MQMMPIAATAIMIALEWQPPDPFANKVHRPSSDPLLCFEARRRKRRKRV
jgi:hypothetical protein